MEVKMAQSEGKISVDLDLIAKQLLQERFILTALELYTEVMEVGQEIPRLRDYFSNPSNFELCSKPSTELLHPTASLNRSSSQTTLDSLDWARYSEDGERALDDRIAVLEFELRKAKETIQGLRDNLTQATAPSEPSDNPIMFGGGKGSGDFPNGDLKPHEVCTLNFLINEYLVLRNYKMTANTFADENDNQDFENWDAVGLNIPRPPALVQWLQEKVPGLSPKVDASCQTDLDTLQLDDLQGSLRAKNFLEEKVKELESRCERQELELQKLHRKMSAPQVMPLVTANPDLNPDPSNEAPGPITRDKSMDRIEFGPTKVTYSKKGDPFPGTGPPEPQEGREETPAIIPTPTMEGPDRGAPLADQKQLGGDDALGGIVSEIPALMEGSSYLDPCEASIEDLIESPSASLAAPSPGDASLSMSALNVGEVFSPEEGKEDGGVENPTDPESEGQNSPELFSEETSEVLDPRKCDRLPPLGASSECSPQGILAGEFISAQRDEARNLLRSSTQREVPLFLESQILGICFGQTLGVDSRLQNEVAALSLGQCDLLNLVSSSVHNIAPNVILSKREELLPLLVYSISQHADSREREGLLHLLFNLTKRPDREQRSTILLGLVNLARVLGADKLEAELLPQCWEQLSHKHPERRLLVAQSVAILAPYTPPPLRNSLLLSMLQQLLGPGGEKEAAVREAAMASLALVVAYLDDTAKLPPLVQTLLLCLQRVEPRRGDSEGGRPPSNAYLLLDAVAHWALRAGRFPVFVDAQLQRLGELVGGLVRASGEGPARGGGVEQLGAELANVCRGLGASLPHVFIFLFESMCPEPRAQLPPPPGGALPLTPSPAALAFLDELSVLLGGREEAERSLLALHRRLELEVPEVPWPELSYLLEAVLSRLVETLSHLEAQPRGVVIAFVDLFSRLGACVGPRLCRDAIAPLFQAALEVTERDLAVVRAGSSALTKSPFVVYCVAVLGESDPHTKVGELRQFLARQISILALSGASTDALQLTLLLLMTSSLGQEEVLGALWDSVVRPSTVVRAATAPLWSLVAGHLKETELASRVVPALVTLATDTDVAVRASAVTPLAVILSNSSSKEVKDKVLLQLEAVCEESQVLENSALQVAIAQTCCSLAHNTPSHLLHNLFLPLLCRVALEGGGSPEEKLQFGVALLEAFTALAPSPMPNVLVAHFILPPLNQLQRSLGALSYEHMETITVLTKEYTLRAQSAPSTDRHRSGSGGLVGLGTGMGGGLQVGVGVEDVKNRMSKMWSSTGRSMSSGLQGKTPSLTLPTLFKKK